MYQFSEDCLIGVELIDDEHRKLFAIMNEISAVLADSSMEPKEVLQLAQNYMERLKEYAATHFEHEEAYMKEIHDPELARQKREHAAFTEKVNCADYDMIDESNGIFVLRELIEFLSRWLYRHILNSDTLIGKMESVHGNSEMIAFSDKYLTGIDMIDKQHIRLFEILGELNALNMEEYMYDKFDEFNAILDQLKDYTVKHFADEEQYMKSINYEGLAAQQRVHQSFIEKMESINLNDVDENQQQYIDELIDYLTSWLINHIMKMDQKIPAEK